MHWWGWLIVGLGAWFLMVTVGAVAWVLLIRRAAAAQMEALNRLKRRRTGINFQCSNADDPGPDTSGLPDLPDWLVYDDTRRHRRMHPYRR